MRASKSAGMLRVIGGFKLAKAVLLVAAAFGALSLAGHDVGGGPGGPEAGSRRKSPTLYTVFQLYCIEELTIPQTARKCRCSLGTVANRLNLLRARTGVAPERLRGISAYFTKYEGDFRQAQRNYRRATGNRR